MAIHSKHLRLMPSGGLARVGGDLKILLDGGSLELGPNGLKAVAVSGGSGMTKGYPDGLQLRWISSTQIKVLAGKIRAASDDDDIVLAADTADTTLASILDVDSPVNNNWYHIFVAKRPSDGNVKLVASLSDTAPASGDWTKIARIGLVRWEGGGICNFRQHGNGRERTYVWMLDLNTLGAGGKCIGSGLTGNYYSPDANALNAGSRVPPTATKARIHMYCWDGNSYAYLYLYPYGGNRYLGGERAWNMGEYEYIWAPGDPKRVAVAAAGPAATAVNVNSFVDSL